jgi:hypothetical protein
VIQSKELSRVHRERLLTNGFLQEVMKGWLICCRTNPAPASARSSDTGCSAMFTRTRWQRTDGALRNECDAGLRRLSALDKASIDMNIAPFTAFVAERVRWSARRHA